MMATSSSSRKLLAQFVLLRWPTAHGATTLLEILSNRFGADLRREFVPMKTFGRRALMHFMRLLSN